MCCTCRRLRAACSWPVAGLPITSAMNACWLAGAAHRWGLEPVQAGGQAIWRTTWTGRRGRGPPSACGFWRVATQWSAMPAWQPASTFGTNCASSATSWCVWPGVYPDPFMQQNSRAGIACLDCACQHLIAFLESPGAGCHSATAHYIS